MITKQQKNRIKLLIEALENGKYKQVRGTLCKIKDDVACFCVEGLMCELYRQKRKVGEWRSTNIPTEKSFFFPPEKMNFYGSLPSKIRQYFVGHEDLMLASKNDGGWSFKRIAKWLRKKFDIEN